MNGKNAQLAPHVLHVLPNATSVELIRQFGNRLRHTLVTADGALPDGLTKSPWLKPASDFPALDGLPTPGRMQRLARALTPFDLVLTHGWGALDVAMAHTLFKDAMDLPALVHHEDAPDEPYGVRRKWYRRLALGKSAGLVVPGELLEARALVDWQQPMGRVKKIPHGIETKAFARPPKPDSFRLIKHGGEKWIGAWSGSGEKADLLPLVSALPELDETWQLIVLGERPQAPALDRLIDDNSLNARVYFTGPVADTARVMGLFDIVVAASDGDGFPQHTVEAMAAARAVIARSASESTQVLDPQSVGFVFDPAIPSMLPAMLRKLAEDSSLRAELGEANRLRAVQLYDRAKTHATYQRLYASAMKREF